MWRVWVLVAGCGFTPGALSTDATGACTGTARWPIETGSAPPRYTLTIDISAALAVAAADELHVFAGTVEIDRVIIGPMLEVRVPASGSLTLVAGAAGTAPANPANVYLFAESFDSLAIGDHGSPRFVPLPELEWNVIDEGGNHIYRALGTYRHPNAFAGMMLADGDIRARMRINAGGGQQHNGLAARGNSMEVATMDGFVGQLQGDSARMRIAEYTNGATPPIELAGLTATIDRGRWYAMRLRYVGDALALYVDGSLVSSAVQTGSDGQLVGLYAHDCNVDYDDVTVRMAVEPEPLAMLGPSEPCP